MGRRFIQTTLNFQTQATVKVLKDAAEALERSLGGASEVTLRIAI